LYLADVATTEGYDGTFVPNKTYQIIAGAIQRFAIALGSNPYDRTDQKLPLTRY